MTMRRQPPLTIAALAAAALVGACGSNAEVPPLVQLAGAAVPA